MIATHTYSLEPYVGGLRLLADGSLDPTFGVGGFLHFPFPGPVGPRAVLIDPAGRTLIAGSAAPDLSYQYSAFLARLGADGAPDTSFGVDGRMVTPIEHTAAPWTMDVAPDGSVLAAAGACG